MQPLRNAIGKHVRVSCSTRLRQLCASSDGAGSGDLTTRVLEVVKKFGRIDSSKVVSEIADFHKDLSLDSLDRVELIMAIEQELSVEIPDKEDKLSCCADVVKYIAETQKIK